MAIEITPKRKIKLPFWSVALGGLGLVLAMGLVGSYFYFEWQIGKVSQELEEKNLVAVPLEKAVKGKEAELFPVKQKIDDFGKLLAERRSPLGVFEFFERVCLPKVWFSDFSFSGKGVSVSGQTDSFITFEHQLSVLRQDPLIEKLNITGVSVNEEEGINFSLFFTFDPQVFK